MTLQSAPSEVRLPEPLVRISKVKAKEDAALSMALETYARRTVPDDLTALSSYIRQYPGSGWNLALHADLGLLDLHFGYFTRAAGELQTVWNLGKDLKEPQAKALVDRAAGELLRLDLGAGHFDRAEALLKELESRPVFGPPSESVDSAKNALWMRRHHPELSAFCGPAALKALLTSLASRSGQLAILDRTPSSPKGVSLSQLATLASRARLDYKVVFRRKEDLVPVPSIVHWSFGHYAAIVGEANGRYRVVDPSFAAELWMTRGAIDAEASGYFLVPKQFAASRLRPVGLEEGSRVRGMYVTYVNKPPSGNDQDLANPASCDTVGCSGYNIHEATVSLLLQNTPVGYAPPVGPPVKVTLSYNQREANQPANFTFFNVSPLWTLNWLSYLTDDPTTPGASVTSYVSGGGSESFTAFNSATGSFAPQESTGAVLTLVSASPVVYSLAYPSGARDVYAQSDGSSAYPRNVFLKQKFDPAGNAVTLSYDSKSRLTSIADASGRPTTLSYQLAAYPLLITTITDPFGRSAALSYTSTGYLNQVVDVAGNISSYGYSSTNMVKSLTTAYGTTSFSFGNSGNTRYLDATDPLGFTEVEKFAQNVPGIAHSDPSATLPKGNILTQNIHLQDSDSYHWDKHANAVAPGNYLQARQRTFLHLGVADTTSSVTEALKQPLENRVWYNYPGQAATTYYGSAETGSLDSITRAGRVLDDGTTQLYQTDYNPTGNPVHKIDPAGRETYYDYAANGIDVLDVRQRTSSSAFSVIAAYTYNSQHLPLTGTDAAGQTTGYQYNAAGQRLSLTDPLLRVTRYQYNPQGYLAQIVDAEGRPATTYTYDAFGRIATEADTLGYTIAFAYDALDRLVGKTYPDGSREIRSYNNLDLASTSDRLGNTTKFTYDADRRLIATTDALGNTTARAYYENGAPKSILDAKGNTTSWTIDIQGRVTAETYPDATQQTTTYEATTSRIKSTVDALGQAKQYSYAVDDRLSSLAYRNAVNATPSVAFTYDPYFQRVATMADGNGTTKYKYQPVGSPGALQLAQESGPSPAPPIAYRYEALGRLSQRSVGASIETFAYDRLGRVKTHGTPLGSFNRLFVNDTPQPASSQLAGSTAIGTFYTYYPAYHDRRLAAIQNSVGARGYQLTYDLPGYRISHIDQQVRTSSGTVSPLSWDYTYDDADHLRTAASSAHQSYQYTYDPLANIQAFQDALGSGSAIYNVDNQLDSLTLGGASTPLAYDANGNLLDDGKYTYTWDAENRLLTAASKAGPAVSTGFRYDGLGRRTAITATLAGVATRTGYQWCGQTLCAATTPAGALSRLYYSEGEYLPATATSLYYARDQAASVRDVLAITNGVAAGLSTYDYDPDGDLIQSTVSLGADFGFAGLFHEPNSGLDLTAERAYSPRLMRWISRDPLKEAARPNLYEYLDSNPVSTLGPEWHAFNPTPVSPVP